MSPYLEIAGKSWAEKLRNRLFVNYFWWLGAGHAHGTNCMKINTLRADQYAMLHFFYEKENNFRFEMEASSMDVAQSAWYVHAMRLE